MKVSINTSRLSAVAALLVIGFFAGRYVVPPAQPVAASVSQAVRTKDSPNIDEPVVPRGVSEAHIKAAVLRIGTTPASGAAFDELLRTLRSWAALNPQAALAYAREHLTLQRQNQAVTEILADWAKTDAPAAWAWATANVPENGTHLDAILSRIGEVNGQTAWGYAAAFAQTHPASAQSAYASALRGITHAGNFDLAVQLLSQTDSLASGVRDGLSTLVATEWGRYEPAKAVAWASSLPAGSVGNERAMINVVQAWAEVDPAAAAKYATQLPAGGARQQAVAQAIPNWASSDPTAAAQWLFSQEPSHDFDQAINSIATNPRVMADFNSAVTLATSISDTELRTQTLTRIVSNLQQRDPAAAERFLKDSADVPAQMRDDVRRRLEAGDLYAPVR